VYSVYRDEDSIVYLKDRNEKFYTINVDEEMTFFMNIKNYPYYFMIHRKNGILFTQNIVEHIDDLEDGIVPICPLCKEDYYQDGDGNTCKVLNEHLGELIEKIRTTSHYRLRAMTKLEGKIHECDEAFKKMKLKYDEYEGRWIDSI